MSETKVSGEEALACGALEAGVGFVTGYPGLPGAGIIEHILSRTRTHPIQVQWSSNSRVALEEALGASIVGIKSLVCFNSTGINTALDPLMTINLTGVKAGLVILLGDDPGAWDSQNEQDSRQLGHFAEIPLLEPASPEEGKEMMVQAFELSEEYELPVMIRITPSFSLMEGLVTVLDHLERREVRPRTILKEKMPLLATPINVVENHERLHRKLSEISQLFELSPFNRMVGEGPCGIIAAGQIFSKVMEVLGHNFNNKFTVLKLGTLFPLPQATIANFLENVRLTVVLEENEPYIEKAVRELAQFQGIETRLLGRMSEHVPREGELFKWQIEELLTELEPSFIAEEVFFPYQERKEKASSDGLCAICPYIPAFKTLMEIINQDCNHNPPIIVGDSGCTLKLNLYPYQLLDASYSQGSAIGIASGIAKAQSQRRAIAIIGESAFFQGGINALINAAYTKANVLILILDNSTSAAGGFQPQTETTSEVRRQMGPRISIEELVQACDVNLVKVVDPEDLDRMREVYRESLASKELAVIILRKPCPLIP
ncbi:MAG: thiamine pyrophosphate-dependent enzyme [candidate division KSB1 bacterium]|nr:thiamine pyrophosphate-dependent enzyme [candidate division KSB1 bacterium]